MSPILANLLSLLLWTGMLAAVCLAVLGLAALCVRIGYARTHGGHRPPTRVTPTTPTT